VIDINAPVDIASWGKSRVRSYKDSGSTSLNLKAEENRYMNQLSTFDSKNAYCDTKIVEIQAEISTLNGIREELRVCSLLKGNPLRTNTAIHELFPDINNPTVGVVSTLQNFIREIYAVKNNDTITTNYSNALQPTLRKYETTREKLHEVLHGEKGDGLLYKCRSFQVRMEEEAAAQPPTAVRPAAAAAQPPTAARPAAATEDRVAAIQRKQAEELAATLEETQRLADEDAKIEALTKQHAEKMAAALQKTQPAAAAAARPAAATEDRVAAIQRKQAEELAAALQKTQQVIAPRTSARPLAVTTRPLAVTTEDRRKAAMEKQHAEELAALEEQRVADEDALFEVMKREHAEKLAAKKAELQEQQRLADEDAKIEALTKQHAEKMAAALQKTQQVVARPAAATEDRVAAIQRKQAEELAALEEQRVLARPTAAAQPQVKVMRKMLSSIPEDHTSTQPSRVSQVIVQPSITARQQRQQKKQDALKQSFMQHLTMFIKNIATSGGSDTALEEFKEYIEESIYTVPSIIDENHENIQQLIMEESDKEGNKTVEIMSALEAAYLFVDSVIQSAGGNKYKRRSIKRAKRRISTRKINNKQKNNKRLSTKIVRRLY
jgi:hypothetical protein